MKKIIRLGSRGSPLALIQAQIVREALFQCHPNLQEEGDIEIVPIRTTGDWKPEQQETTFLEMGGNKGLFTKEIEEALLAGAIDFAVHSMKDVPTNISDRLEFAALLERGDPRDAFLAPDARTLDDLPAGARVGTSSPRRQAQILARRPDVRVIPFRGNVDTRLRKLAAKEADATILAVAGLMRLDMMESASSIMDTKIMLPSVGQGVLGIEVRRDDEAAHQWLAPINSISTATCLTAERALLKVLDGSCRTPIAALAQLQLGHRLKLEALVAKPDGTSVIRRQREGAEAAAETMGKDLGLELKNQIPPDFFSC